MASTAAVVASALCMLAAPVSAGAVLEVVFEEIVPLDSQCTASLLPDSLEQAGDGGLTIHASCPPTAAADAYDGGLRIEVLPDGRTRAVAADRGPADSPGVAALGRGPEQWLVKTDSAGDTLWRCRLEDTGEFDNAIATVRLSDHGYLVVSRPDCWSTATYLARVGPRGELLWSGSLTANYLLDMPDGEGEICPRIASVRQTRAGDLLVCGSVSEWVTSPKAMFAALLDGGSGEAAWKAIDYGDGMAGARDIVETASGGIVAVGATAPAVYPDEGPRFARWGEDPRPYAALIGPEGNLRESRAFASSAADVFTGVLESPIAGELIIIGDAGEGPAGLLVVRALL